MNQYNRHAIAPLNAIFPSIKAGWENPNARMTFETWTFNIHSLRLRVFCRDAYLGKLECSCCGLKAEYFAVESFLRGSSNSVHVNLYGRRDDGTEELFTHDHTQARALGGADSMSNCTTMCYLCNNRKSKDEGHEVNIRRLFEGIKPEPSLHNKAMLVARSNPAPAEQLEIALIQWAANKSSKDFSKKVDTFLQRFGWKRKQLKEKINEGVINFTLHPVKD